MSLGSTIKQLREAKDWTQGQLATYSKLSRSYISRIEKDNYHNLGSDAVVKLAKALNVTEDFLFEAAGLKPSNEIIAASDSTLRDFVVWLAGKNPSEQTVKKIKRHAEVVLEDET